MLNSKRTIGADHVVVPTAFWKVVVDPANGDTLAFIMPQQALAKGKLDPWQVSISKIEQAASITLPLAPGTDRTAEPPIWQADLSAWKREHAKECRSSRGKTRPKKS